MAVFFVWLDPSDVIVAAGMAPSRESYDEHITAHSVSGATVLEVDRNLTGLVGGTYDHDTGEVLLARNIPNGQPS